MAATRKNNGDGSVYQVSENLWRAKLYIGKKSDGKPNIKQFSGKTELIVKRKLKEYKKTRGAATESTKDITTVKQYLEKWLYQYKYLELKPASFDRLESTVKKHIMPSIWFIQIKDLTDTHILEMLAEVEKTARSYSSIKKVYDAIKSCLDHAVSANVIPRNPMVTIKPPSKSKYETKHISIFTDKEIEKILYEIEKKYSTGKQIYQNAAAFKVILYSGLRIGEIAALSWEDVDFNSKSIRVHKNVSYIRKRSQTDLMQKTGVEYIVQDSTKSDAGDRIVYMNQKCLSALQELKKDSSQESDFVLCNSKGNPSTPQVITRTFYSVLDNCGIKRTGVHTLRHTFASRLFRQGVDVKTVSEILGHKSIGITYDTYIHVIKEQKKAAIELMDDFDNKC